MFKCRLGKWLDNIYVTYETIPDVTDDFDLGVSVGEPTWDWAVDSDVEGSWNKIINSFS